MILVLRCVLSLKCSLQSNTCGFVPLITDILVCFCVCSLFHGTRLYASLFASKTRCRQITLSSRSLRSHLRSAVLSNAHTCGFKGRSLPLAARKPNLFFPYRLQALPLLLRGHDFTQPPCRKPQPSTCVGVCDKKTPRENKANRKIGFRSTKSGAG